MKTLHFVKGLFRQLTTQQFDEQIEALRKAEVLREVEALKKVRVLR